MAAEMEVKPVPNEKKVSVRFNGLPFPPRRKKSRDPLAREAFDLGFELLKGFLKMRSEERREAERRQQPEFIIEDALLRIKIVRQMAETLLSARPVDLPASVIPAKAKRRGRRKGVLNEQTKKIQKRFLVLKVEGYDDVRAEAMTVVWLTKKKNLNLELPGAMENTKKTVREALKSMKK